MEINSLKQTKYVVADTVGSSIISLSATENKQVPLTRMRDVNGEWTINDGSLICPNDGFIMVQCGAMFSPKTGYNGVTLKRNSSYCVDSFSGATSTRYGDIQTGVYSTIVNKGDKLTLFAKSDTNGDGVAASERTHITAWYIHE